MVSISAFQALDPGSIPGCDILFCSLRVECARFSDHFSSSNVESKFLHFFFPEPPPSSARLQCHESWCVGIRVLSLTSGRIDAISVESSRVQTFYL